jgi:hypothetical protein
MMARGTRWATGRGKHVAEDLDGDMPAERDVARAEHVAHPTGADGREDLVVADTHSRTD